MRQAVLESLSQCKNYLVPDRALYSSVKLMIAPQVLYDEYRKAIEFLEVMGWIRGVRPEIGGDVKWTMTELGKAQL